MPALGPALLEEWMRKYYFNVDLDIGSSGVEDLSFAEVRALTGLQWPELDGLVFRDSETLGGTELREAAARRWTRGQVDRVMITHGSSEANYLVMTALLEPGDDVLVVTPAYQQLSAIAEAIGCRVRGWPLAAERQFGVDVDSLRAAMRPDTRMVVVNFPHNPTGVSVTEAEQRAIVEAAAAVGAYLVWDGAFAEITYERPPLSDPGAIYERAITLGTLSKCYGLPGLRVGWCLAAADVLQRFVRIRDYLTLHLSPLVELIARLVIESADAIVASRLALARCNRELVAAWAAEHADMVRWAPPAGGVCAFPCFPDIADTEDFCTRLAEEQRVLLVPGECFGHRGHIRLGFGRRTDAVREGLTRLSEGLSRYHRPK